MNSNKDSKSSDYNKENHLIIPESNTADTNASTLDTNQEIEDEFKNQEEAVSNENANDYSEQIVINTEEYQMYQQQHQQQQQQHQINPIPSAYSWRLISTNYYSPAVLQPSHNTYHHPVIDFDSSTQSQQQQQPQWQNDQAVASTASTAYLAPVSQYVGTPQPQATTPVYSLDPNAEIAYDHFGYQNISYNYPNNYNGNMMPQPAWSSHPVSTNPAYTPNYDNTTSPNSTSNKQQQHQYQFSYDDYYSKDKLRSTPMGINSSGSLAYHYVPADPVMYNNHLSNIKNNISTSSLAQHIHTDNNNFPSANGFYMNTAPYHRVNHYHEANIINGYPNKHVNGKAAKMYENDSSNKKKSYQNNNQNKVQNKTSASQIDENNNSDKKRYSDIVAGDPTTNNSNNNVGNINNSNLNETSLSISPQSTFNKNQDEKTFEENSGNIQNFYNPIYNSSHSNQYQKKTNYKQSQSFYSQHQYHDSNLINSAHLEAEMANLNLFTRFYPLNSTYTYENTKQKYRPNINKTSNTRNNNLTYDQYNPKDFYVNGEHEGNKKSKFFIIKSYSKDDVIHCIRHGIWCSTEEGNKKLDKAFVECSNEKHASVYLFFSVNGSGQFCGMAQMMSRVDYDSKSEIWSQDKWQGTFEVKWIFIKDVPNVKLRHIVLFNNENKPVTNSRDTQEVFYDDAIQVLNVVRQHLKKSSILDEYDSDLPNQFDYSSKDTSKQYISERKNKNNF